MSDKPITNSFSRCKQILKTVALSLLLLPVASFFVWGGMNYAALAFGFGTLLTIFVSIPSKEEREEKKRLLRVLELNETLLRNFFQLYDDPDLMELEAKLLDMDTEMPKLTSKVRSMELQLKQYEERLNDYQVAISELEELSGRLLDTVFEDYKALHWKETT